MSVHKMVAKSLSKIKEDNSTAVSDAFAKALNK